MTRFYHNSSAHHERLVFAHSKSWIKEMNHLKACWGDDEIPSLEITRSPGRHMKELEMLHHYNVPQGWITNGPGDRV